MANPVFELYNADGSLQFNMAGRVPRILGSFTITAAGSLQNNGLTKGDLFFTLSPGEMFYLDSYPTVTKNGSTLNWSKPSVSMILTYGVY